MPTDRYRSIRDAAPSAGPYYVASAGDLTMVLRRNPHYRGSRPRRIPEIWLEWGDHTYRHPNFESIAVDVYRGRVDWAPILPLRDEQNAIATRSPNLNVHRSMSVRYLRFDATPGQPLANVNLRKGLAMALDRAAIARALRYRRAIAFDHFLPPTVPGSRKARVYALRPAAAELARARDLVAPFLPLRLNLYIDEAEPESWLDHGRAIAKSLEATGVRIGLNFCVRCVWVRPQGGIHLQRSESQGGDPADFLIALDSGDDRITHAKRLPEPARLRELGRLDIELARHSVPAAALSIETSRELFSRRVGCIEFHRVHRISLGALCFRKAKKST